MVVKIDFLKNCYFQRAKVFGLHSVHHEASLEILKIKHYTIVVSKEVKFLDCIQCIKIYTFHSEFLDPLSKLFVGYKSKSNDANDSKKEDSFAYN